MAFCSKCGNQVSEGERFCGKCGTTVGKGPSAAPMVPAAVAVNQNLVLAHLNDAFLTKPEFANGTCKIFEGMYTDVAISSSGYIGFYRPAITGMKKMDQPEYFEVLHASQINDFDLDVDEDTKVSSGLGGAIIGGLIGGGTGAVIGSAATGGKVKNSVRGIDLILNTKDFHNPRRIIPLYMGTFMDSEPSGLAGSALRSAIPPSYWKQKSVDPKSTGRGFTAAYSPVLRNPYNCGQPPVERIQELVGALNQIMAAHADKQAAKQAAAVAAPQLSSADEILKFKQLLDAGVITQEEFDAKKRQLIG